MKAGLLYYWISFSINRISFFYVAFKYGEFIKPEKQYAVFLYTFKTEKDI